MAIKSSNRGVAMFVVLGAIVLMTVFGLVGLELAKHFSDNSSSMVDMRSERMTAIGGLNLAVAAFEKDPTTTATLLEQYRQDAKSILSVLSLKSWVVFPTTATGNLSLSSSQTWAALNGTNASVSSVSIKILGISSPSEDHADVTLEGHGRGRNGDEFVVQATYRVHGLGMSQNVPTKGPTNALQVQGGISHLNTGLSVDGGLYSGSTSEMHVQGSSVGTLTKIRCNGNLYLDKGVNVLQRSIISGAIIDNTSDSTVFNDNLVVKNGLSATSTGRLHMKKNFLLSGSVDIGLKAPIVVDSGLYVEKFFSSEVGDTVGGVAYFKGGLSLAGGSSYFGKSLFIEGGNCVLGTGNGGKIKVAGNFFMRSSSSGASVYTATLNSANVVDTIMGNVFFNVPLDVSAGKGSLVVLGQSYFAGGVNGSSSSSSDSIALLGDAFLARQSLSHTSFASTVLVFGSRAIMNSQIDVTSSSPFGSVNRWKFRASGSPRFWSFNATGTSYSSSTLPISNVASFSARQSVINSGCMSTCQSPYNPNWWNMWSAWTAANPGCFSGWGWKNYSMSPSCQSSWNSYQTSQCNSTCGGTTADTTVSWPWLSTADPLFPSYADLGFGKDSVMDPAADINSLSVIQWNKLSQSYKDAASWTTICNKYNSRIPGLSQSDAPSASQLDQLYQLMRADGGLYGGTNGYLLVHVSSWNWNNMNSTPLSSGTKIFFEFDNFSDAYLYAGTVGSIQVVEAFNATGRLSQLGSFYGFVQLHTIGNMQFQPTLNSKFYGSLEVGGSGVVTAQDNAVNITNLSAEAVNVFQDITRTFSLNPDGTGTGSQSDAIIWFNGDKDQTTMSVVTQIKLQDGWVQFERLGEFR